MFKVFFILFLTAPTIALAGSHSRNFWNTFWASIIVGLVLIFGIKIFELGIGRLFFELKRFLTPESPTKTKRSKK